MCNTHRLLASGANLCPSPLGPRRATHLLGSSSGFDAVDAVDAAAVGGDDAAGSVGLRQGAPRGDVGGGLVVDEVLLGLKIRTSSCAWKYSDFFCIKQLLINYFSKNKGTFMKCYLLFILKIWH